MTSSIIDALRMAWSSRHPDSIAGVLASDRGSSTLRSRLQGCAAQEYGITSSMSRRKELLGHSI
jgi:transposase InsO family protein